jgi:hypothetical protein
VAAAEGEVASGSAGPSVDPDVANQRRKLLLTVNAACDKANSANRQGQKLRVSHKASLKETERLHKDLQDALKSEEKLRSDYKRKLQELRAFDDAHYQRGGVSRTPSPSPTPPRALRATPTSRRQRSPGLSEDRWSEIPEEELGFEESFTGVPSRDDRKARKAQKEKEKEKKGKRPTEARGSVAAAALRDTRPSSVEDAQRELDEEEERAKELLGSQALALTPKRKPGSTRSGEPRS